MQDGLLGPAVTEEVAELDTRGCLGELDKSGKSPSAWGVEEWCARVWAWMGPGGVTKPQALSTQDRSD